ncbi:family 17 putative glycoside hydrolase [Cercophora samala]|uniref:Probable glucan endo-1,3-beta-glucosidase eglC n=1 Tax=Cercophora samala TaxID=330535 RepID=A0AA39ZIB1_9PEZI|nr:family 17 putative glycoside hydrolase [Cercophora samala]
MRKALCLAAFAATLSPALGAAFGYNSGAQKPGGVKNQADYENEFRAAKALEGAPAGGFTSVRLFTMLQDENAGNNPIEAIPAAIATNMRLLLGLWASAGSAKFDRELEALVTAVNRYGDAFIKLVDGISVGSEDLYRNSDAVEEGSNPGANPQVIVGYIQKVRQRLSSTKLRAPIGHVDTWTAWVNGSNAAVVTACDWVGMDAYPYWQSTALPNNAIEQSPRLFQDALDKTRAASQGKPVWITETGHPVSGRTWGQSVASVENAKRYWNEVGCPRFGKEPIWWYKFQGDQAGDQPNFGITPPGQLTTKPLFDISCKPPSSSSPVPLPVTTGRPGAGVPSTESSSNVTTSSGVRNSPRSDVSSPPPSTSTGSTILLNGTVSATSSSPATNTNGAGLTTGSVGGVFAALLAVVFAV